MSECPTHGEEDKASDPLAVLERVLGEHATWVNSVAISPDGQWAVSGSDDMTVKVWDLETGKCLSTLSGHLVIRDAEKTICWMNVTAYLKTCRNKKGRQVVFDGEKLDAAAVLRARERHLQADRR